MNHLFRTRPHFQEIINKQALAHYRLHNDKTTRTTIERASFERSLLPVPLIDVELPKLPMVRLRDETTDGRWVVFGEVAQSPGQVLLMNMKDGSIEVSSAESLELVPPSETA